MKELIWKIVLPLTVISFTVFTKWWFVLPVDARDSMMYGFPLIWISEGWHTSMSSQIFITEWIVDLLVYFTFWFLLFFIGLRLLGKISIARWVTTISYFVASIICAFALWIGTMSENIYLIKRDFEIKEVVDTGYKCIWQNLKRPVYSDYKKQAAANVIGKLLQVDMVEDKTPFYHEVDHTPNNMIWQTIKLEKDGKFISCNYEKDYNPYDLRFTTGKYTFNDSTFFVELDSMYAITTYSGSFYKWKYDQNRKAILSILKIGENEVLIEHIETRGLYDRRHNPNTRVAAQRVRWFNYELINNIRDFTCSHRDPKVNELYLRLIE